MIVILVIAVHAPVNDLAVEHCECLLACQIHLVAVVHHWQQAIRLCVSQVVNLKAVHV
jgi:hypothetical protein